MLDRKWAGANRRRGILNIKRLVETLDEEGFREFLRYLREPPATAP